MKKITIKARAKVNLSLIICSKIPDGFHEIDTVMCPVDISDTVTIERRSDMNVFVNGVNINAEDNTAFKAARILMAEFDTQGMDITIKKEIPMAAGLGGSSADAAAVMLGFSKLFDIEQQKINFLAKKVGSDIPFMLQVKSGAMRARGVGDILTEEEIEPLNVVIAKPDKGVITKDAYRLYDEMALPPSKENNIALINALKNKEDICAYLINDLFIPANKLNGEIEPLVKLMKKYNRNCAVMSGSGSAVAAICDDADSAQKLLSKIPDNYYKIATTTALKALEILE
ncbi:MAG: 4-(cytidine 5'-diphospho)-2-C-methyl-D-erythritol kinase [Christensenellales bacterium]|jgi:4-diphosphocytidyl-2-C-methyl-D-erythritol kinase